MSADTRAPRVAFLSDAVWPFHTGGKERRLAEITGRLAAAGVDVHVYTMKWWNGPRTIVRDGVHLHAIGRLHPLYRGGRRSTAQAVLFGLATFRLLWAPFDVLDADHMPYVPLFAARLVCTVRRRRLVATWHEVWGAAGWRTYLGRWGPLGAAAERLAARLPDAIVSVSPQTTRRLVSTLGVTAPVYTVNPGVALRDIDRQPVGTPPVDILYAGRLLAHKNVDLLLRAVALLVAQRPALRCRIVGEGPERARLDALRHELGLAGHVELHDFLPAEEIYGAMRSARVLALPSVREGFGCVVLEANACDVPVVTVDHPDNAARHLIVEGGNGYLASVDAADLARALGTALDAAGTTSPRAVAHRAGLLRDWDEVATAVLDAIHGQATPDRPPPPTGPCPAGALMEIVQVVALYPPHLGGQEAVAERLAALQALHHRVTVYTSRLGAAGHPGVERRDEPGGVLRVVRQRAASVVNTPVMPGLLPRLLRHAPRPDVIHVHTGQALVPEIVAVAATLRGIRYVAHQHLVLRPSSRLGRVLLPAYFRLVYGPVLRRADRIICLTAAMRDETVAVFGVDPGRVAVVGNGVDTTRFGPREVHGPTDEVLFVGRLAPQKNVGALLHAAARLRDGGRDVRVRIVGDGEDGPRLRELARRLRLTGVRFEGRLSPAQVAAAYARATVLVMPSTHEGMPLVLLEAMAAGIPVVAAALPEIVELAGDTVVTVDVAVPGALADALGRILDDAPLRGRLAAAAADRAAAHSWPAVAAAVERVYAEVLAR